MFRFLLNSIPCKPLTSFLTPGVPQMAAPKPKSLSTLTKVFTPASTAEQASQATNALLPTSSVLHQSVRTNVRVYYKGSAWKRYNKHNIEKRLTTPGGIDMLWRKTLKGKFQLAAYQRILPNTVNSKILPAHAFKYKAHPTTKRRLPKRELLW